MSVTTKTKPARRRAREPKPTSVETPASAEGEVAPTPAPPVSKIAQVIGLLRRAEGATLEEMVAATGWLPHTTRAALTGLKKKGHLIDRSKRGEASCYSIATSEA